MSFFSSNRHDQRRTSRPAPNTNREIYSPEVERSYSEVRSDIPEISREYNAHVNNQLRHDQTMTSRTETEEHTIEQIMSDFHPRHDLKIDHVQFLQNLATKLRRQTEDK